MERGQVPEAGTAGMTAVIFGAVAWGSTGIFVEEIRLDALPITFYRLWLGVVLLGTLLLVRRRRVSLAVVSRSVVAGLFLAADIALFFAALKLTSVAVATVIGALQPALVLLVAGRMFGERVGWRVVLWTVVSIAGIAAVAVGPGVPHGAHLAGDALAVGSLLAFTGYWLVSKRVIGGSADSDRYTFGVMLVAAVAMTPVVLLSRQPLAPVSRTDWFWLALLALVPGTGHLLFNFAHRHVDVSVSSVVSAGNPVVASALALLVLGEPLDAVQIAGGIVAVLAIAAVAHQASGRKLTWRPGATRLRERAPRARSRGERIPEDTPVECRSSLRAYVRMRQRLDDCEFVAGAYENLAADYDWMYGDEALADGRGINLPATARLLDRVSRDSVILDAACGTGVDAAALARRGFTVGAADASAAMCKRAATRFRRERLPVKTLHCQWADLPAATSERFDVVLCIGNSLVHAAGREAMVEALTGLRRMARPGGHVVIDSRNWEKLHAERKIVQFADRVITRDGRRCVGLYAWEIPDRLDEEHIAHLVFAFENGDQIEPIEHQLRFRPFTVGELRQRLELAGLAEVDSDFDASRDRYAIVTAAAQR